MTSDKPTASGRWLPMARDDCKHMGRCRPGQMLPEPMRKRANNYSSRKAANPAKGCVACHTVGKGTLVEPDLAGVTATRPYEAALGIVLGIVILLTDRGPIVSALIMPQSALNEMQHFVTLHFPATSLKVHF